MSGQSLPHRIRRLFCTVQWAELPARPLSLCLNLLGYQIVVGSWQNCNNQPSRRVDDSIHTRRCHESRPFWYSIPRRPQFLQGKQKHTFKVLWSQTRTVHSTPFIFMAITLGPGISAIVKFKNKLKAMKGSCPCFESFTVADHSKFGNSACGILLYIIHRQQVP